MPDSLPATSNIGLPGIAAAGGSLSCNAPRGSSAHADTRTRASAAVRQSAYPMAQADWPPTTLDATANESVRATGSLRMATFAVASYAATFTSAAAPGTDIAVTLSAPRMASYEVANSPSRPTNAPATQAAGAPNRFTLSAPALAKARCRMFSATTSLATA